jgi:hypothetical protein
VDPKSDFVTDTSIENVELRVGVLTCARAVVHLGYGTVRYTDLVVNIEVAIEGAVSLYSVVK